MNATKPDRTFATKQSALETLRKIGDDICHGRSRWHPEVRSWFRHESCLAIAMCSILDNLETRQVRKIALQEDEDGRAFVDKVQDLLLFTEKLDVFEGMEDIALLLDTRIPRIWLGHWTGNSIDGASNTSRSEEESSEEAAD